MELVMTNSGYKRIESGLGLQFDIMQALEQRIAALKSQSTGTSKELDEMEALVKYLAKTTSETTEEILKNVA